MSMGFIDVFMEIYNVDSAIAIIFFCGLIILKARKADRNLIKAKLFLNNAIVQRAWMYISVGVVFLAINALIKFLSRFTAVGDTLGNYYTAELTQIIFLMAFTLSIYNCYLFINSSIKNKDGI